MAAGDGEHIRASSGWKGTVISHSEPRPLNKMVIDSDLWKITKTKTIRLPVISI